MPNTQKTYIVYMGQAFKYALPEVLKTIGCRVYGGWRYTDDSSTEIAVTCGYKGTANELQQEIWSLPTYGSVWVRVEAKKIR